MRPRHIDPPQQGRGLFHAPSRFNQSHILRGGAALGSHSTSFGAARYFSESTKNTYSMPNVTVGTVKKSIVIVPTGVGYG